MHRNKGAISVLLVLAIMVCLCACQTNSGNNHSEPSETTLPKPEFDVSALTGMHREKDDFTGAVYYYSTAIPSDEYDRVPDVVEIEYSNRKTYCSSYNTSNGKGKYYTIFPVIVHEPDIGDEYRYDFIWRYQYYYWGAWTAKAIQEAIILTENNRYTLTFQSVNSNVYNCVNICTLGANAGTMLEDIANSGSDKIQVRLQFSGEYEDIEIETVYFKAALDAWNLYEAANGLQQDLAEFDSNIESQPLT